MGLAVNIHKELFEAIEAKFAEDNDLMQICGTIYRDLMPSGEDGQPKPKYPCVVVSHAQEGGLTDHAATSTGLVDAYELMPINFDVVAATCEVASQIGWQIAAAFMGWTLRNDMIEIHEFAREQPVWSGQTEERVCMASVLFTASVAAVETEE